MKNGLLVLAVAMLPMPALAQQSTPTEENDPTLLSSDGKLIPDISRKAMFNVVLRDLTADGPGYGNHASSIAPEFSVVASDDSKQARIALSFDISNPFAGTGLSHTTLTVVGTTDLAKKGPTSFGDFASGLTGGTAIELALMHYAGTAKLNELDYEPVDEAKRACENEHAGATDLKALCDPAKYKTGVSMFVSEYNRAGLRRFLDSGLPGDIEFFGIKGKASQTDFSYLDQAAFATKDETRFSFTLTALYGRLLASGRTSLTASFTYGRNDKADDDITLCQPVNATQTRCITAAGGPPKRMTRSVLSFEARQAFGGEAGPFRLAVAPLISYDLKNEDFAADFPIYLIGDGNGKLRGGFRITYENAKKATGGRKDDVKFGVFVGVPFSLFN